MQPHPPSKSLSQLYFNAVGVTSPELSLEDALKKQEEQNKKDFNAIKRAQWLAHEETKVFLEHLRSIITELDTLAKTRATNVSSTTTEDKLRVMLVESNTLEKVIHYARSGNYNT